MRRRIFRRIFMLYAIVLLLSISFVEIYITRVVRENYIENLKDSLAIQANLISSRIPFHSKENIDILCRELKDITGARVTIIALDGKVLGDSDKDSSLMDNHGDRLEIQHSGISDTGWSIRYSNTLKYDLLYTARKVIRNGNLQGFIRLAVPLKEINTSINLLRFNIIFAVILTLVASAVLLLWQTGRIRRFVIQIADFSRALAGGDFNRRLFLEGAGEFEEITESLNTMSAVLEKTMERSYEETNCLQVILKSIPDALLIINTNGIIEQSNNAFSELFGNSTFTGKPFIEVIRSPEFFSLIDDVKRNLKPASAELRIDHPEERFLMVNVSPLFYREGELSAFVALFHDTTQLKKLEQIRKDFVANVSHEIKTPVTAIKGFAETLLDGALDDRENAQGFLNTIKAHSERLNRLVEDLLTLSRIELGVIRIHKTGVYISEIIDSVMETLKGSAVAKGLYLKKSSFEEDMKIQADRDRITQILLNLADNAIKFTEKGGVEIGSAPEEGRDCLFVKDTGIGIPRKYLSRLGERFFRVDPSRSRELGGTGLGLAIVKHLVRAHGWEMKIESEEGKGAVVRIFIG